MNKIKARTRTIAVALTLAFFAAIVTLIGLFIWQGYRDAIDRGLRSAEVAAYAVSEHMHWITEASRQALRRIDETLGAHPELVSGNEVADIDEAIASLPSGVYVRVFDRTGRELLTSDPSEGVINVADRDYFHALRDGKRWEISPLITDRAGKRQVFAIGRRLERQGSFAGIAVVLVPAQLMSDFWSALALGPGSAVSIIRSDGWLVARHPIPDETIDLSQSVLFRELLPKEPTGSYVSGQSPADGVSRLVGYRQFGEIPLVAIAAIATDTALADYHTRLFRLAVAGVPIGLVLAGVAWWVTSLLRRDENRRQELEKTLEQNRLLFREVHHRVKNNLQTVASLIQLQDIPAESKRDLRNRIAAMASVHEQIYRSDHLGEIRLDRYLRGIIDSLRTGHEGDIQIDFHSEPVALGPDQAMAVGLIVTELVANSLKHGFAGEHGGAIKISVTRNGDNVQLTMRDTGRAFDPSQPTKGIGLKLVRSFAKQLNGSLDIQGANGLRCELSFPIQRN